MNPNPRLPREIADELKGLAAEQPDKEICGLILCLNGEWEVKPITNTAGESREFHMDNDELLSVYQSRFGDIVGVYHSHPSGRPAPSGQDVAYAQTQWRYFIVAGDEVCEFQIDREDPQQVTVHFIDRL